MNAALDYLSHPLVLTILGIAAIVILFFIFRSFFKFVIICLLLLLLSVVGYHFYHAEGKFNERMRDSLLKSKGQIEQWVERGKTSMSRGKEAIEEKENKIKKKTHSKYEET
jgi:ABC-type transport system involved in cytochrome bd biosynthesis fused ATPase/permease subunit